MRIKIISIALICIFLAACTKAEDKFVVDLQFVDNQHYEFRNGRVTEEVMYYALGEHGEYHFVTGNEWTNEYMTQLIDVSEDAIKFVKDWLGYEDEVLINFIYGNKKYDPPTNPKSHLQKLWFGGNAFDNEIFINASEEYMPALIAHEAVHTILNLQERQSNFPLWNSVQFLEEGLADVIDYLFFLETEHVYDLSRYVKDKQAAESHLHEYALIMFEFYDNFEDEKEFGSIYPQLMSYETSASFIYYLLEYKGTKEDFMRVFDDINLMEEVYGVSMDGMITQWLEFLEQI